MVIAAGGEGEGKRVAAGVPFECELLEHGGGGVAEAEHATDFVETFAGGVI